MLRLFAYFSLLWVQIVFPVESKESVRMHIIGLSRKTSSARFSFFGGEGGGVEGWYWCTTAWHKISANWKSNYKIISSLITALL